MSLWFLFTFRRCLFRDMNAVVCHDECIGMSYLCLWFCKQHELVRCWMCLHMNWRACDILYVCLLLFFNVWEWASCLVCVWELDHREKCVCVGSVSKLTAQTHSEPQTYPLLSPAQAHTAETALLRTSAQSTKHCLPKHHITHPAMVNLSKTHRSIIHWLCMSVLADF